MAQAVLSLLVSFLCLATMSDHSSSSEICVGLDVAECAGGQGHACADQGNHNQAHICGRPCIVVIVSGMQGATSASKHGLLWDKLALEVNERRAGFGFPVWTPADEVFDGVLVHGVAVLQWAAMYDLEITKQDAFLKLLCQSHLRDNPRIGAFVVYTVREHFALDDAYVAADHPDCRREPSRFRKWLQGSLGKRRGIAGDEATTLESVVARYSEALDDQSPILLWPMHEVTAALLVRGGWPADIVGLWRGTVHKVGCGLTGLL
jgi:hypothetical protein